VHEDDSSSPRDKKRILELKRLKSDRVAVHFDDEEQIIIDKDIILEFDLYSGKYLSPDEINQLRNRTDILTAKKVALSLIMRQRQSKKALALKLMKKKLPLPAIHEALAELEQLNLVDDTAFAHDWITMRMNQHPEGRQTMYFGLLKKGVDKKTASSAVSVISHEEECEMAHKVLSRSLITQQTAIEISKLLYARGFSRGVIREIIRTIGK
jgi:regulatory protein